MSLIQCDPALLERDLSGKVVVITGGYGGIGREVAEQLLNQKATVVIGGRDAEKGSAVATQIGAVFFQVDMSDMDSVRAFAARLQKEYSRLDVLMLNAGAYVPFAPGADPTSARTKEGWEIMMASNYLGHVLLVDLLLGVLKKTGDARIVHVSSCAADAMPMAGQTVKADVDLEDPHWKTRTFNDMDAYGQSKLAQILHTRELASRLEGSGVKAVALHPGWGNTDLFRHGPWVMRKIIMPCFGSAMGVISARDAAQVPLHCALSPELVNGAFYSQIGIYEDARMQKGGLPMEFTSPNATPEKQAALWAWTRKELNLED